MKREPITNIRAEVQDFVRFLRETGEASLETKNLPERKTLQRAVRRVGPCVESLIFIIENSGIPEDVQEVALLNLWSALASAYMIGSQGTVSENTEVYIKVVGTAPARSTAAKNREPDNERIRQAIAEAEKIYPPDRRGNIKRIAQKAGINPRTLRRHRKKKRTS